MKIRLKFVALRVEHLPKEGDDTLELEEGAVLTDALQSLGLGKETSFMTLVNESSIPMSERADYVLKDGDELTLFTPLKGG